MIDLIHSFSFTLPISIMNPLEKNHNYEYHENFCESVLRIDRVSEIDYYQEYFITIEYDAQNGSIEDELSRVLNEIKKQVKK